MLLDFQDVRHHSDAEVLVPLLAQLVVLPHVVVDSPQLVKGW